MSINEEHFYQGTEGFLGEQKECKVLFLMKEPDSGGDKVEENKFWFKRVVNKQEEGKKYLSKLGQIASWLVDGVYATDDEQRIAALKKTVYINMNPVCGQRTASTEYYDAIKQFRKEEDPCKVMEEKYISRWKIIYGMPDQSTIVTVRGIYDAMYSVLKKKGWIVPDCNPPGLVIRNRLMSSFTFEYKGKKIDVLKTLHPAAFGKYNYVDEDIYFKGKSV